MCELLWACTEKNSLQWKSLKSIFQSFFNIILNFRVIKGQNPALLHFLLFLYPTAKSSVSNLTVPPGWCSAHTNISEWQILILALQGMRSKILVQGENKDKGFALHPGLVGSESHREIIPWETSQISFSVRIKVSFPSQQKTPPQTRQDFIFLILSEPKNQKPKVD